MSKIPGHQKLPGKFLRLKLHVWYVKGCRLVPIVCRLPLTVRVKEVGEVHRCVWAVDALQRVTYKNATRKRKCCIAFKPEV